MTGFGGPAGSIRQDSRSVGRPSRRGLGARPDGLAADHRTSSTPGSTRCSPSCSATAWSSCSGGRSSVPMDAGAVDFFGVAAALSGIESYPASILARLQFWPFLVLLQGVLSLVIPTMLLAFWAARQHPRGARPPPAAAAPGRHGRTGSRLELGLVHPIDHVGPNGPEQVFWVFSVTQSVSGLFGGLGYVALFGLVGQPHRRAAPAAWRRRGGHHGGGQAAAVVLSGPVGDPRPGPRGLGTGTGRSPSAAARRPCFAVGVWLLTRVLAYAQERAGQRGPAEVLLRRLVYPRSSSRAALVG